MGTGGLDWGFFVTSMSSHVSRSLSGKGKSCHIMTQPTRHDELWHRPDQLQHRPDQLQHQPDRLQHRPDADQSRPGMEHQLRQEVKVFQMPPIANDIIRTFVSAKFII